VKAYQLTRWEHEPEFRDVEVPEPGPGEVLVRIGGAGACHSDLHVMEWPEGQLPYELPFTLGHENAGWVEKLGPGAGGFSEGDPVAIYGPWGCGHCRACMRSAENYCEHAEEIGAAGGGLGRDGGMAEHMLVPSPRLLVPLPGIEPWEAAPLTDAGLTPYHAIKRALPLLPPGSSAVVIGVGGLGHMAVQILRATSATQIIAVDLSDKHLELAREVGADHALKPGEGTAEEIRELTRGQGAELVLDIVGAEETMALGAAVAHVGSKLTVLGLAGGSLQFQFGATAWETALEITYWGSRAELVEVLDLAAAGLIKPHIQTFSLDEAPAMYERMRAGELAGRAVVTPNGAGG
jgi:alcohol dehydrogenase, propanol-preferring